MLPKTGLLGEPSYTHCWDSLITQAALQQPFSCTEGGWSLQSQGATHCIASTVPPGMVTLHLPLQVISELETSRKLFLFPKASNHCSLEQSQLGDISHSSSSWGSFPALRCSGSVASEEAPVSLWLLGSSFILNSPFMLPAEPSRSSSHACNDAAGSQQCYRGLLKSQSGCLSIDRFLPLNTPTY